MTTHSEVPAGPDTSTRASWLPMVIIGLGQAQMTFNVSALPVLIGPIVNEFDVPPTTVGTAIVVYSLAVASFVMVGAKIGQRLGSRTVFQAMTAVFAGAMTMMVLAPSAPVMLVAQAVAGLAASCIVPALVVLIATNYKGQQQAQALGLLGGVAAVASVVAFFAAGALGTLVGWRIVFGLLVPVSLIVVLLSWKLKRVDPAAGTRIDAVGVLFAALGVALISFGFNNLTTWGVVYARPAAPFAISGVSPAPLMIVFGGVALQAFYFWSHRRARRGLTPLLALEVLDSRPERMAVVCMFVIVTLGNGVMFLEPLYVQMVQGGTTLDTAVALIPYQLAIFGAATFVVRIYARVAPYNIARMGFALVAFGAAGLAVAFSNNWGDAVIVIFLVLVGLGEGALVTLLFNVLVTSSPKALAGDVGALRGTTSNLASAVGTALAGALAVGLLAASITRAVANHPEIPQALVDQVNLDEVNFIDNERLTAALQQGTTATPVQVEAAVAVNADARLQALKISFLCLSGLALLMIIPASGLPRYVPGEVPKLPVKSA